MKIQTLILPACDTAEHFLDWSPEPRKPHGSFVRTIAMRTRTVDNKLSNFRVLRHTLFRHRTMRNIHSARNMTLGVQLG